MRAGVRNVYESLIGSGDIETVADAFVEFAKFHGVKASAIVKQAESRATMQEALQLSARADCPSCRGYGHFNEDSEPSIDKRDRKCSDCRGTGRAG